MSDSSSRGFVHLHVHTEYSMLDGAARVDDLFREAARMQMPALAMTDHGNVFGAYEFWKKGQAAGVKPLIGMEAYVAPGTSRYDRTRVRWAAGGQDDVSGGGAFTHMTLLAESTAGMHNLFRMASRASLEGYYYKPRVDRELLAQYADGVIGTTGCPSGEIQTRLRIGDLAGARRAAGELQDIFGKDSFFCELMDHGIDIERRVHAGLIELARDLNLPLLATNDLHYTFEHDAEAQEVLLCVQSGRTMADANRLRFDGTDFYLKSSDEMRQVWRELPEACDNTLLVAERCDVMFAEGADLMPRFPVPPGETEASWLRAEVVRGLARRLPDGAGPEYQAQADYELAVIGQMGYPGYFLVVADLVRYARDNGIRVGPGRGSAAGSMVAYALGITELDPIGHKLSFERFLNPERVSMPDIDMDFDERRRGDMIRYATEKYGEERVAQIITYSTIKAKAAVKDAARVLGFPYAVGDRITKAMPPPIMGKDVPLAAIFDPKHERYGEGTEFRSLYDAEPDVKRVVDTARGLEGLRRQWGVHAAGVILSREPLIDVIPIQRREQDGAIITQFDMGACEALGLLKMDFLGLRTLTVLDDCIAHIQVNRGETVDLEVLPLDNPATYELLSRGDTLGVFQFDGGPMRSLLRAMRPDSFGDISAVNALYRPGPMGEGSHIKYAERKNGRQQIEPIQARRPRDPLQARPRVLEGPRMGARQRKLPRGDAHRSRLRRRLEDVRHRVRPARQGRRSGAGVSARALARFEVGGRARGDREAVGDADPVRRLCVQQVARCRLRATQLLDGVPQGQLPGRVHGRPPHQHARRQGQERAVPARVPAYGHQGPAARRQRVRLLLHPPRHRHPLRPVSSAQRRRERRRRDCRGTPLQGPFRGFPRLLSQGSGARVQQESCGVSHQGRCVRLSRPHPARTAAHPRRRGRRVHGDQAGRGDRAVRSVRWGRRRQDTRVRARPADPAR